jgi:hypothetical protein
VPLADTDALPRHGPVANVALEKNRDARKKIPASIFMPPDRFFLIEKGLKF